MITFDGDDVINNLTNVNICSAENILFWKYTQNENRFAFDIPI